jgi:hypothetical protein
MDKHEHQYSEAFCLMRYASQDGHACEMLWNSRNGVTPFGLNARGGALMYHIDWNRDRRTQRFVPPVGMRVFVDLSPERAREIAERKVNEFWEHPQYPMKDRYPDKEAAIQAFIADFRPGEPDVITVDEAFRQRLIAEYQKTPEPIEYGDEIDLRRNARGFYGPVRFA